MTLKPNRVDKASPLNELYDDLKNHTLSVILAVIVSLFGSLLLSGYFYIQLNHLLATVTSNIRRIPFTFLNLISYGITGWWIVTLLLFFVCLFISFRIYRALKKSYVVNYENNYLEAKRETYGGAHFQTPEELDVHCNKFESIEDTTDDILGTLNDTLYSLKPHAGSNRNYLYYGPPGVGKTASIVKTDIYQAIRRGESLIVSDSKGTVYNETSAIARKCGYKVRVFNTKPDELSNSDGFDLFASLDPNDPTLDIQADVITTILFENSGGISNKKIEDFWRDNEFNLTKMVIMMHATDERFIRQGKNNLADVYNYIATATMTKLKADVDGYDRDSSIYQTYSILEAIGDSKIQGQIINGAAIRLRKLGNPIVQRVLSHNEIDTVLPMKEKCIYYVIISDQDKTYSFLSSLFYNRMFIDQCRYSDQLSREEKKMQRSVHYVLDEYKSTGGIIGLEDKIANVRSRKIALTLILQNTTQLNMMYGEEGAETIKECCYVKALLGGAGLKTTQEFSDLLGSQTIISESHRFSESTADVVHAHGEIQKTLAENERPLLYATDMINGNLGHDEIIYVIAGMPPIRLNKYFSEKSGEAIHPMEAVGMILGEKKASLHKPLWRYAEEQAKLKKVNESVTEKSDNKDENDNKGKTNSKLPTTDPLYGYEEE